MVDNVVITNLVTGRSEVLSSDEGSYIIDSIDWGMPSVDFDKYRVPFQIGETVDGVVIGTRNINIVGYVVSDLEPKVEGWAQYYDMLEKDISDKKIRLDKLINVNQDIMLTIGKYRITGRPTQFPKYSTSEQENNDVLCLFSIEVLCHSPMFNKGEKVNVMLGVSKMFHFPLIIPKSKGVILGIKRKTQALIVNNEGDVETGLILTVTAVSGEVVNPKVYNVQNGEYIGFSGLTLNKGDRLIVNTNIGEQGAVRYDSENRRNISVINLLTIGSTLMRLKQGATFLLYDLENETLKSSNITVSFYEQYANIRGM